MHVPPREEPSTISGPRPVPPAKARAAKRPRSSSATPVPVAIVPRFPMLLYVRLGIQALLLPLRLAVWLAESVVALAAAGVIVAVAAWYFGLISDAAISSALGGVSAKLWTLAHAMGMPADTPAARGP